MAKQKEITPVFYPVLYMVARRGLSKTSSKIKYFIEVWKEGMMNVNWSLWVNETYQYGRVSVKIAEGIVSGTILVQCTTAIHLRMRKKTPTIYHGQYST